MLGDKQSARDIPVQSHCMGIAGRRYVKHRPQNRVLVKRPEDCETKRPKATSQRRASLGIIVCICAQNDGIYTKECVLTGELVPERSVANEAPVQPFRSESEPKLSSQWLILNQSGIAPDDGAKRHQQRDDRAVVCVKVSPKSELAQAL